MKHSETQSWTLYVGGVDRRELSIAFAGSRWAESWIERSSPIEDNDPYSDIQCSLPISSMDELMDALRCVWNLNASYGINLHFNADFGACKVTGSLCTKNSGFAHSDITLHRTVKSLESEAVEKLTDAERSLSELRNLLAMKDAT